MVYVALHGYGRIAEKAKRQGFAGKNKLSPMLMDTCMGQP
jgi:hypothetical protein